MAFELGTTVGDYEFIEVLHSSKSGVTYKVRNHLLKRLEVLRVMPSSGGAGEETTERFLREMKIHAAITHPNIVSFYNATRLNGSLVMTTEFIEGVTLAERLETGPLPLEQALQYMCEILAALECAHGHGIVHRDVTPENILLVPEGVAKLTGFGLARGSDDTRLTQAGAVLGSLHYISPEQIKGVDELDGRADIYSVGIILYELVTGKRPFDSVSQFQLMAEHVNQHPVPPIQLNRNISYELNHIVLKALEKHPGQRFQAAEDFRARLESVKRVLSRGNTYQAPAFRPLPRAQQSPLPAVLAAAAAAMPEAADSGLLAASQLKKPRAYTPLETLAAVLLCILVLLLVFMGSK